MNKNRLKLVTLLAVVLTLGLSLFGVTACSESQSSSSTVETLPVLTVSKGAQGQQIFKNTSQPVILPAVDNADSLPDELRALII